MPKVPYQPYSDVAPSGANISVPTPPEAFGVGVAKATEGLGGEIERSGDKLFNRAIAIQQLNNEAEAEQANLRLMDEVGGLHANYNALQGEERVKAYPKYRQDLLAAHARVSGSLSNDMARRMYDRAALTTIGRTIFNGAGAAASAQREWYGNTASSTMDMAVKTVSDDPLNDILYAQKKSEIIAAANRVAYAKHGVGPESPIAQDLAMKGISAAARERIISVSHVDPWRAGDMEEQAIKSGDLTGPDKLAVDNSIRSQRRTVGAANIANEVYNPELTVKEMETRARDKASELDKNDPILAEHAVQHLKSKITTDNYIKKQEELVNKEAIMGGILGGAKNEQELFSDPKLSRARDALPDSPWKVGIPGMINRYQAAKNKQTDFENDVALEGMRKTNPIKYLNEDITKWQLSNPDMKRHIMQQQKIRELPQADPQVQQFIGWMRPLLGAEMRAAGVYSPPTKAEGAGIASDYDKFAGLVSVGIQEYITEHGKPPRGPDAVKEIGQQVLRNVAEPYFFGLLSSDVPYFKKEMNTDEFESFKKQITDESLVRGITAPSDTELERMYRQMDYKRFYGKKKESGK